MSCLWTCKSFCCCCCCRRCRGDDNSLDVVQEDRRDMVMVMVG